MNIFKLLASGKKGIQEEHMSAIIAWLLNPRMNHGLGYIFVYKLLKYITINKNKVRDLENLKKKLGMQLNNDYKTDIKFSCFLEYKVENITLSNAEYSFIDIVIKLDDILLAIENKLYADSITDITQLSGQYGGLKKITINDSYETIIMIFLVPIDDEDSVLDPKVERAYDKLCIKMLGDLSSIVTWQKSNTNYPSISGIIEEILKEETKGLIDPMPEYTRHTLKAFNNFINNYFLGYDYDETNSSAGINPLTEEICYVDKLYQKNEGFVGVKGGLNGLLQIDSEDLKKRKFQYTRSIMSYKSNWLDIYTFKKIINWKLYGIVEDINWQASLPSSVLYEIARDYKDSVYIGIKGGKSALENMHPEKIKYKKWGIRSESGNSNWIDGSTFYRILEHKRVFT